MMEEMDEDSKSPTGADSAFPAPAPAKREPRGKLFCRNYLEGISGSRDFDMVEVQFKNTRKGFYRNTEGLDLRIGDMVAVEASPGHDIGRVNMVGKLVAVQMRNASLRADFEPKRIFRKARETDMEKYREAIAREHDTMIRSRLIAEELGLDMKIGDVEYQGDGAKAIFYYIADERVDFRKLIRILADTFKVRIEMKQIGARQEAGRIGGIGPCGRPLCCSQWLTRFVSVGTNAARFQDLSMNPQKLAGQCAKLKCCLNFEVDAYMESNRKIPHKDAVLQTKDADYYLFKTDILARKVTYSTDKSSPVNTVTIDASRAFEIIALNKRGIKVDTLAREGEDAPEAPSFVDLVEQDSLTRFDKSRKKKKKRKPQPQRAGEGRGDKENSRSEGGERQRRQGEGRSRQRPPRPRPAKPDAGNAEKS